MQIADIARRYHLLETALVYDVLDTMGLPNQQLSLEIQPLHYEMVLAGPAFTSKMAVSEAGARVSTPRTPPPDPRYDMLEEIYPGCILVEDVGNDPVSGGLGENMGLSVQMKGCVGVICDGGTRDKKALIKARFPVFSRFSSMTFSRNRRRQLDYQPPVRLSGHLTKWVTVNPGDWIFGDSDGIVVVPKELTLEVLESARRSRSTRSTSASSSGPVGHAARSTPSTATHTVGSYLPRRSRGTPREAAPLRTGLARPLGCPRREPRLRARRRPVR